MGNGFVQNTGNHQQLILDGGISDQMGGISDQGICQIDLGGFSDSFQIGNHSPASGGYTDQATGGVGICGGFTDI